MIRCKGCKHWGDGRTEIDGRDFLPCLRVLDLVDLPHDGRSGVLAVISSVEGGALLTAGDFGCVHGEPS